MKMSIFKVAFVLAMLPICRSAVSRENEPVFNEVAVQEIVAKIGDLLRTHTDSILTQIGNLFKEQQAMFRVNGMQALLKKFRNKKRQHIKEQTALVNQSCPKNFRKFRTSCYLFTKRRATWHAAQRICKNRGAGLVSIESNREQLFVVKEIKKLTDKDTWIGASSPRHVHNWKWVTKRRLKDHFAKWCSSAGGPDNHLTPLPEQQSHYKAYYGNETHHCLQLWKECDYKWDDALCSDRKGVACELKLTR